MEEVKHMLKVAKDAGLTDVLSEDGSNPLTTQHPIGGSAEARQLYLFNDDATKRYEGITIDSIDTTDTDESGWVEFSSDGSTYQAGPLSMADISDSGTGYSFYVRVTTPSVGDTQNKTDIELQVVGTEYAV